MFLAGCAAGAQDDALSRLAAAQESARRGLARHPDAANMQTLLAHCEQTQWLTSERCRQASCASSMRWWRDAIPFSRSFMDMLRDKAKRVRAVPPIRSTTGTPKWRGFRSCSARPTAYSELGKACCSEDNLPSPSRIVAMAIAPLPNRRGTSTDRIRLKIDSALSPSCAGKITQVSSKPTLPSAAVSYSTTLSPVSRLPRENCMVPRYAMRTR